MKKIKLTTVLLFTIRVSQYYVDQLMVLYIFIVCVCVCVCVYSVTQACHSLVLQGPQPTRLLCPWEFSRQEYWNGLPCPPLGDLPNPQTEPVSLVSSALVGGFFTTGHLGSPVFLLKKFMNVLVKHITNVSSTEIFLCEPCYDRSHCFTLIF